jgi:cytochrome oxidase Cu insertion factor (SCO1/SenC/PrrC family)
MANHFGVVQERFRDRLGRDLVLLTVTFDPARDTPERLAEYASQWKADPDVWHMLTGPTSAIQRVCNLFGVDPRRGARESLASHCSHRSIGNAGRQNRRQSVHGRPTRGPARDDVEALIPR